MEQRFENWRKGFYAHLEKEHPDLVELYEGRIYILQTENGGCDIGINAIDAAYIGEEKKQRMVDVFKNYGKAHPF